MNKSTLLDFVPPESIEAERSVLGSCLIEAAAIDEAVQVITAEDFYRPVHQTLFALILELHEQGTPVDLITVQEELKQRNQMQAITLSYLLSLFDAVPTAANIAYYAQIVREKSLLRKVITEAMSILTQAQGEVENVPAFLDQCQEKMYALGVQSALTQSEIKDYHAVLDAAYEVGSARASILAAGGSAAQFGVSTGLISLDGQMHGLNRKTLTIVAARPAMGKSALAIGLSEYVALHGVPVHVFSMEMSDVQIGARMLAGGAMVDSSKLMSGEATPDDFWDMGEYIGKDTTRSRPLTFDFSSDLTIGQIRAKARRLVRQKDIGLFVVDYLQLIKGSGAKGQNREQEVAEIASGLKAMAKELNVAVLAVAQVGRGPEGREDKRPLLSDLRESGGLEASADIVLFLYREDYYAKKQGAVNGIQPAQPEEVLHEGFAVLPCEVIIAKHRDGSTGMVRAGWQANLVRFVNLDAHTEHYLATTNGHGQPPEETPYYSYDDN